MSRIDDLLRGYIAEHRSTGDADPAGYLSQVSGADRLELAAHIDRYLEQAPPRPFDADAFARFRADPRRQALVEEVLDDTTLEALRKQASVSKVDVGARLATALDLEGREQEVKARYHDIEAGNVDPTRVRAGVWRALADLFGSSAGRLRAAAENAFSGGMTSAGGMAYARTAIDAMVSFEDEPTMGSPRRERDDAVDRAFFED